MAKMNGFGAVTEMMAHLEPEEREKLLANLAKRDPTMAKRIQENTFAFDDLLKWEDSNLQKLLAKIPQDRLALALRKSSEELKSKVFANLPRRAGEAIRETMDSQGPQKLSKVREAQIEILTLAKAFKP